MNQETIIQRKQMLALSESGLLTFRNETARAWVGKTIHKAGNQVTLANAQMIPFGLCIGSSDIIAIAPTVITQEMVGQTVGIFTAIETKTKTGRPTKEQLNFMDQINKKGGRAGIARSPEEALLIARGKHDN